MSKTGRWGGTAGPVVEHDGLLQVKKKKLEGRNNVDAGLPSTGYRRAGRREEQNANRKKEGDPPTTTTYIWGDETLKRV